MSGRVEFAVTLLDRLRGLLFRPCDDVILIIAPCNDIHTFGMRRPIDVAFATRDGKVVGSKRCVEPGSRVRSGRAAVAIERFSRSGAWFELGDDVGLRIGIPRVSSERKGRGRH